MWSKISSSLVFDESVTNGPTDRLTDRPGYRDAMTHLKIGGKRSDLKFFESIQIIIGSDDDDF